MSEKWTKTIDSHKGVVLSLEKHHAFEDECMFVAKVKMNPRELSKRDLDSEGNCICQFAVNIPKSVLE